MSSGDKSCNLVVGIIIQTDSITVNDLMLCAVSQIPITTTYQVRDDMTLSCCLTFGLDVNDPSHALLARNRCVVRNDMHVTNGHRMDIRLYVECVKDGCFLSESVACVGYDFPDRTAVSCKPPTVAFCHNVLVTCRSELLVSCILSVLLDDARNRTH